MLVEKALHYAATLPHNEVGKVALPPRHLVHRHWMTVIEVWPLFKQIRQAKLAVSLPLSVYFCDECATY